MFERQHVTSTTGQTRDYRQRREAPKSKRSMKSSTQMTEEKRMRCRTEFPRALNIVLSVWFKAMSLIEGKRVRVNRARNMWWLKECQEQQITYPASTPQPGGMSNSIRCVFTPHTNPETGTTAISGSKKRDRLREVKWRRQVTLPVCGKGMARAQSTAESLITDYQTKKKFRNRRHCLLESCIQVYGNRTREGRKASEASGSGSGEAERCAPMAPKINQLWQSPQPLTLAGNISPHLWLTYFIICYHNKWRQESLCNSLSLDSKIRILRINDFMKELVNFPQSTCTSKAKYFTNTAHPEL